MLNEDIYPCTEQEGSCRVHSTVPPPNHTLVYLEDTPLSWPRASSSGSTTMKRLLQDIRHSAHVSLQRQQYSRVGSNALSAPPHSWLTRTLPWFLQLAFFFTTFGFVAFRYQTVATDQACTSRLSPYCTYVGHINILYGS